MDQFFSAEIGCFTQKCLIAGWKEIF